MSRIARAWRQLDAEQRLAAIAALALTLSMFLPWYQQNAVDRAGIVSQDLDAFAVFSVLEASILIAALGVLTMLFVRAEGRAPYLAGIDGGAVLGAGCWVLLALVLRLFDKPGVESHGIAANVGVQWGIFFALGAAGLLTYAGVRMRAAQRQPPVIRAARARGARAYRDAATRQAATRQTATRQTATRQVATRQAAPEEIGRREISARRASSRRPPAARSASSPSAAKQLSFDDETSATVGDIPPSDSA